MALIRRIRSDDWQAYKMLRMEAVRLHPEAFGATYASELARDDGEWRERVQLYADSPAHAIFVADNECQLVGMVGMRRHDGKRAHVLELWGMYVQADYRGRHLGCALIREALGWARRSDGVRKVRLELNATNTPAHKLYLANGFQETGLLRQEMRVDEQYCDLILMEIFL